MLKVTKKLFIQTSPLIREVYHYLVIMNQLFFFMITSHCRILISLYVDDMIIIGDNVYEIDDLKLQLFKKIEMKDLGTVHYFLGIEVIHSIRGYLLSHPRRLFSSIVLERQACILLLMYFLYQIPLCIIL